MAVFAMMAGFNVMESESAERKLTSFCCLFCWKIHQKTYIWPNKNPFVNNANLGAIAHTS